MSNIDIQGSEKTEADTGTQIMGFDRALHQTIRKRISFGGWPHQWDPGNRLRKNPAWWAAKRKRREQRERKAEK